MCSLVFILVCECARVFFFFLGGGGGGGGGRGVGAGYYCLVRSVLNRTVIIYNS